MNSFTLMQKVRNKIRVAETTLLSVAKSAKIVHSSITVKGRNNRLVIDEGARIYRTSLEIVGNNCLLHIGKNSMIGDACYLSVKEDNSMLLIGENCGFSRNTKVMTSDGHPIYQDGERINLAKNIIIEDDVWIADNVTVLKGVKIGKGSVIGINATVVKNVPSRSIAVGNPAKVVKENIMWKDKF